MEKLSVFRQRANYILQMLMTEAPTHSMCICCRLLNHTLKGMAADEALKEHYHFKSQLYCVIEEDLSA